MGQQCWLSQGVTEMSWRNSSALLTPSILVPEQTGSNFGVTASPRVEGETGALPPQPLRTRRILWTFQKCLSPVCCCLVAQSCPTLCDPMDCIPPGSSVHGISQVRILEWVATSFSRGSSPPRDQPVSPTLAGRFFNAEPPGKAATPIKHLLNTRHS